MAGGDFRSVPVDPAGARQLGGPVAVIVLAEASIVRSGATPPRAASRVATVVVQTCAIREQLHHRQADGRRYGGVTRALHWLTAAALALQFSVGYSLDLGGGRGRGRGRSGEPGRGRGRGGEDPEIFCDDRLLTLHVVLGGAILALVVFRFWWRRRTTLPPWAPTLSAGERVLAHWTERTLYALMLAIPLTGVSIVAVSSDLVAVHVGTHVVFFAALAAHVGLVLKHQLVDRDGLLRRML